MTCPTGDNGITQSPLDATVALSTQCSSKASQSGKELIPGTSGPGSNFITIATLVFCQIKFL
jgi:hypothetical protein